jgi:hypothetical protein
MRKELIPIAWTSGACMGLSYHFLDKGSSPFLFVGLAVLGSALAKWIDISCKWGPQ